MNFSIRTLFAATLICAGLIWLVTIIVGIRAKELQREVSLQRNSYGVMSDAGESVRKQIGNSIRELKRGQEGLTIANASIHFFDQATQIALHCVGWRHSNISKAELSDGHSVTEIELVPLDQFDDGVLFIFTANLNLDWVTRESNSFEEFRIRLLDYDNQALTEWSPIWVWGINGDRGVVIHQPE